MVVIIVVCGCTVYGGMVPMRMMIDDDDDGDDGGIIVMAMMILNCFMHIIIFLTTAHTVLSYDQLKIIRH